MGERFSCKEEVVGSTPTRSTDFSDYRPQFFVRTTDVTGKVASFTADDGSATEMVLSGDRVKMTVELFKAIAIEQGMRFAIREGSRTIGAGVASKILK